MRILICDDIQERGKDTADFIHEASGQEPDLLVEKELTERLKEFFRNVRNYMAEPAKFEPKYETPFDNADLVFLDNNLAALEVEGTRLTAESIAGYIRAFTTAPYIVSLNINQDVDFDLRYLVGDYSTRSDLALNTAHLANRSLWTGDRTQSENGFHPWYWPTLITAADRRREQIAFVRDHLDEAILEILNFDEEAIAFLSRHARGALSPKAISDGEIDDGAPIDKLTFRDNFLVKDRSLPFKAERESLSEAEKGGNAAIKDVIARVVAADLDLWFRRDVVGPQEPLVDVPHLLMRFPFLLGDRAGNVDEWNGSVDKVDAPYGLDRKLYDEHLAKTKFEHDIWVPTPCFWWPMLKADEKLNEYFFQTKGVQWADLVFCEDRSAFLNRSSESEGESPLEFAAEFEGSWTYRYVSQIEGIQYAPKSRLAA